MISRILLFTICFLLLIANISSAQNYEWQFDQVFPTSVEGEFSNSHGVVVDNHDKLWNAPYFSILLNEVNERRNNLYIYNKDGTPASFSPIFSVVTGDSLLRFGPLTGINKSPDGNIYVVSHGFRTTALATYVAPNPVIGGVWNQSKTYLIVLNPNNGEVIEVVDITYMRTETVAHAPNRPAVTQDGYVAISFVFPASPIVILDPSNDWQVINTVTNEKIGFSRTLEISADGKKIFNPSTEPYVEGGPTGHLQVLEAADVHSTYSIGNPLAIGTDPGAISRYPNSSVVYFSGSGTGNGPLTNQNYLPNRYYGIDHTDGTLFKIFDWNYDSESDPYRTPRGLAFTNDGFFAYLSTFTQGQGHIQRLVRNDYYTQNILKSFQLDVSITDANSNTGTLRIGTKADATLGYDADYDQYAPPAPPVGAFDARIVSGGEDFYTNFYPVGADQNEWLIKFSPSTNGIPITIQWDAESLSNEFLQQTCVPKNACFGELMLTDAINGSFVNVDMTKTSEVTITQSFITQLKIVKTSVDFSATIRVADTGGNFLDLGIGTTSDATNGFDMNLDQYAPPAPPAGAFDARIRTSTDDYLKNILPTTETSSEWVIAFAPSTGKGPITLTWDPEEFPEEGQLLLTDVINQQLVRVNMRNQSSYTVTMDGITQLKVVHRLTSSYQRQYAAGWNLVGLPLEIPHDGYQSLFPGSMANTLFSFGSGYQSQSTLQSGKGYWMRFQNASTVDFEGIAIGQKQLSLNAGWNLISGLSDPVTFSSISDPSNIIIANTLFEFTNGYRSVTQLQPGLGYWIRANASGTIQLSASSTSKEPSQTPDLDGFDRIVISNKDGQNTELYFGKAYPSGLGLENFSLPPVPPGNIMDVRFADETWVQATESPELVFQHLQPGSTLSIYSGDEAGVPIRYQVNILGKDGTTTTKIVKSGEQLALNSNTDRVEIQRFGEELPSEFTLDQNYPNPFNPTTTIRFGLPESAEVTLEVYSILGQKVMTLINENRSAGWHTVSFNGAGLSSGVYIYRIQAGGMVQTKKLMLVK